MHYITINEKLKTFRKGDELPKDIVLYHCKDEFGYLHLNSQAVQTPASELLKVEFVKIGENEKEIFANIFLENEEYPIKMSLDRGYFFKWEKIIEDYEKVHFPRFKPGSLIYVSFEYCSVMDSINDLVQAGAEGLPYEADRLPEGSVATVLEKHTLDDLKLLKILYKDRVCWTYDSAFYDAGYVKEHGNDNHYI